MEAHVESFRHARVLQDEKDLRQRGRSARPGGKGDLELLRGGLVFPIAEGIDPGDAERLHARKTNRNSVANRVLKTLASRAGNVGDIYKVSRFLRHSEVEQTQRYIDGSVDEGRDEDFIAAMT